MPENTYAEEKRAALDWLIHLASQGATTVSFALYRDPISGVDLPPSLHEYILSNCGLIWFQRKDDFCRVYDILHGPLAAVMTEAVHE